MTNFLYLFRGGETPTTPQGMQDQMQKWVGWMKELGQKGHLKGGEPLEKEGKVLRGKNKAITDWPTRGEGRRRRLPHRDGRDPRPRRGAGEGMPDLRERRDGRGAAESGRCEELLPFTVILRSEATKDPTCTVGSFASLRMTGW